jgi:hypothetical protein
VAQNEQCDSSPREASVHPRAIEKSRISSAELACQLNVQLLRFLKSDDFMSYTHKAIGLELEHDSSRQSTFENRAFLTSF